MSETLNNLAVEAQTDAKALLQLWYKVYRYAYKIALKYRHIAQRDCAVDADDLKQCAFMGFHRAVMGFDPVQGDFTTVLSYGVRNACRRALGMGGREKAEHHKTSLDAPIAGNEDITLGDMIPDASAADAFDQTEIRRDIEKALRCLPEELATIVRMHDLDGVSIKKIAEQFDCDEKDIRIRRRIAFYKIRAKRTLANYVQFRHKTLAAFRRDWSSVVEDEVIRRLDERY